MDEYEKKIILKCNTEIASVEESLEDMQRDLIYGHEPPLKTFQMLRDILISQMNALDSILDE